MPRYGKATDDTFSPGRRRLRRAASGSLRQAFKRIAVRIIHSRSA